MLLGIFLNLIFFGLISLSLAKDPENIEILGIEPPAGPIYGETRVLVRVTNFDTALIEEYPHPKCRFGSRKRTVNATYVKCPPYPRKVGEMEALPKDKNETCFQCENSPKHEPEIVPFTVSVIGDFTDAFNSVPYRYYEEPKISYIYPRYGPKDGNTFVEVYGENFLNFDQNLRCAFGSKEVKAYYVNPNYMICYSPSSSVVQNELPFSISLNNQQNTKQYVPFVYYEWPQVYRLEPNRGPDTGHTIVRIRGNNFNPLKNLNDTMSNYNDTFCRFGNLSLTNARVISSTEMECVSPPSFEDRFVPVEITLNNREWTRDNVLFYYYHPPFIYYISPKIGPVSGGTVVTISGSNFENTGYVMCKFGQKFVKGVYKNENELQCTSPQVEKPGNVGLAVAIRADEFSSGINTIYKYYAEPVVKGIEPACGPERGFTQLTMTGINFPDKDSEYVKCVFGRKIFTNATVMSETEIKCDSPSVLNYNGVNEKNITEYDVELTLNGIDINGPKKKFYYYKDTWISSLTPDLGPIEGNTVVNISGYDFTQKGACNVTVRFATQQVKPETIQKEYMTVRSPMVNLTGAVVVQIALNGRQYDKDITVNYRDQENTYYYYKNPLVLEVTPNKGPTIGDTEIDILGVGFADPLYDIKDPEKRLMYYRFIDCKSTKTIYGSNISQTTVNYNHHIVIKSPRIYKNNTVACIQLSYNDKDFQTIPDKNFTFYVLPNITDIEPKYGPLKSNEYDKVKVTFDKFYCSDNCDNIICRYKSRNNHFYEKGQYIGPNTVNCSIPKVNHPESFNLEVAINGEDYTNNNKNYTFYDPYVIKVEPQMASSKGYTKLKIIGYGFADSGDFLKVKFGSKDSPIKCDYKSCIKKATYIDENTIEVETFPRDVVVNEVTGKNIGFDRFAVEVSVYNDDFTNNNITIFYFNEPEIINDLYDTKIKMDSRYKSVLTESLVRSLPANLDTVIPIPVDSTKIYNYFRQIDVYANYTCKFQIKNSTKSKITHGVITSFPQNESHKNLFLCQSPVWEEIGPAIITISLNSYDFSDTEYTMTFTDPINVYKLDPPCGPIYGGTEVDLYGTGFFKHIDYNFKWGVHELVPMSNSTFLDFVEDDTTSSLRQQSSSRIMKIKVKAPRAPNNMRTVGGPDYIAVTKTNYLIMDDLISKFSTNNYIHTNYEYYYYHQPYIQSFTPHGSVVTGGTQVLVVGAWFHYKPEYGVKIYCRFGDKIVEGIYLSSVRISCTSPAYDKPNVRVPFDVSLNRYDFTESGLLFTYYNDFRHAKFESMVPTSGPETGGTQIKLYGQNFTNMVNPEEFMCQFKPEDATMQPKNVPAGYQEYPSINKTAIICNSPGGWSSGTKASILISFDGQNFMPTGFDFYFYKVDYVKPMSGPSTGNGPINIVGGGFQNSTKVKCSLANVDYRPISITEHKIECPMPGANFGANFTGAVDLSIMLNGIDPKNFKNGFYYYIQPTVSSIYPSAGPSRGNALVKVMGTGFKGDFPGSEVGCKIGDAYGKGEVVNSEEMNCYFKKLPLIDSNRTMNFSVALNNYSFTTENVNHTFTAYGIIHITPSSGPIQGGNRIEVKGAGFFESKKIRCRFGVPGYYYYTSAEFIDYNRLVCPAPEDFKVPVAGQIPFSVPFSIAFNDDEFNPWTETSHFYSFYENPEIDHISPVEGRTTQATEVTIFASEGKTFSMPSATVEEEDVIDFSSSNEGSVIEKKQFTYQPVACRFGRFGITQGVYVNRTVIKCLTPAIQDDSDVGYEEVEVEVAVNGVDFVNSDDAVFTFIGPNAGRMLWVYVLITIFTALLIIVVAALLSSYWNRIASQLQESKMTGVYAGEAPHVVDKRPRYLIPELRQDLGDKFIAESDNRDMARESHNDANIRNLDRMV